MKYGVIPQGAGGSESGRKHAFFSSVRAGQSGCISGPIEIAVDLEKAVASGVDRLRCDFLTAQHVPNTTLLWVVDDKTSTTIWAPPDVEERREGSQGSSSLGRPSSKPETDAKKNEGKAVPVDLAVKFEDDNQATVTT